VKKIRIIGMAVFLVSLLELAACSPVKTAVSNQYKLEAFSSRVLSKNKTNITLLVSQPESMAGNQTEQMRYIQKPFELESFVHNAWVSSPANMIYPLIVQSMQRTGYFYAVASGPYVDKADYRLDTQIIALQQSFLRKPSVEELVVKAMLTHIEDNRIVASRIINQRIPCPMDTPYGGVLAANKATLAFTAELDEFVISNIKKNS
jgi:cholesterol transport system auxiliary component